LTLLLPTAPVLDVCESRAEDVTFGLSPAPVAV
jgi:hypothetical protein